MVTQVFSLVLLTLVGLEEVVQLRRFELAGRLLSHARKDPEVKFEYLTFSGWLAGWPTRSEEKGDRGLCGRGPIEEGSGGPGEEKKSVLVDQRREAAKSVVCCLLEKAGRRDQSIGMSNSNIWCSV